MGNLLQGLSKTFNLTSNILGLELLKSALPLSTLSNQSSAHQKYPFETEVKMLSASHGKTFDVNVAILALTKTQTIFDAKEQIGLAFEKQF